MTKTAQTNYKATFILNTRGVETNVEGIITTLKEAIAKAQGSVQEVKNLGRKDFVRLPSRNHLGDHYIEISFSGPRTISNTLRQSLRLEKTLNRVLVEAA